MTGSSQAIAAVREGIVSVDPPALLGGHCADCGRSHFPQRPLCPDCQSANVGSAALSSTGTIYTFTIVRSAPPGYLGETPYAYGIVELPEGLRITSTITADELQDLSIGDEVQFELLTLEPDGQPPLLSFAYRREAA